MNWHKGTALNHLLDTLGLKCKPDVVSIYIGDDHTDEDAFRALKEGQLGEGGGGAKPSAGSMVSNTGCVAPFF